MFYNLFLILSLHLEKEPPLKFNYLAEHHPVLIPNTSPPQAHFSRITVEIISSNNYLATKEKDLPKTIRKPPCIFQPKTLLRVISLK